MAEETTPGAADGEPMPARVTSPIKSPGAQEASNNQTGGVEAKEEERLLDALRRRLIDYRGMGREQRRLIVLALVLLTVVALLLLTSTLPQPVVLAGVSNLGAPLQVPAAIFAFSVLALAVGWVLVLSGAMRAVWYIRFPVAAASALVLGTMPLTDLGVTLTAPGGWAFGRIAEAALRLGQVMVVVAFAGWAVRPTLAHWRQRRAASAAADAQERTDIETPATDWPARTIALTIWLVVGYYAVELVIWLINLGPASAYMSRAVAADLGYQANALLLFLDVVVFWAATDLAEWGTKLSAAVAERIKRLSPHPWMIWGLTVAAGLAILLARGLLGQFGGLSVHLLYLAVAAGLVLLLLRFARLRAPWLEEIPLSAPPLGAAFAFGMFSLAVAGGVLLSRAAGQPVGAPAEDAFQSMLGMLFVVLALVMGVLLVTRGRLGGRVDTSLAGIFVFMVGMVLLSLALPEFLARMGIAWLAGGLLTFGAVQVAAAMVALGSAGWYLARRHARTDALSPVVASLLLLGGIEALDLLLNGILPGLVKLGSLSITATAGLFLLGIYWDIWTSGGGTNGHSHAFPRSVRLLLYVGYTLFAAITLLYTSAERVVGTNQPVVASAPTGEVGMIALGVPFVALVYALHLGAWQPAAEVRVAPAPALDSVPVAGARFNPAWTARVVAGAGIVVGLAVVAVTIFGLVPRVLVHPAEQRYTSVAPGTACDHGGGQWNEVGTVTLTCAAGGTRATVPARGQGEMEFLPPDGAALPARFQAALRVDLAYLPHGCAGLYIATDAQLFILGNICADGHFSLVTSSLAIAPLIGPLKPGASHTLTLRADPSSVSLALDGSVVGHLALPSRANFQQIGVTVSNLGQAPGSAVVSDFVYSPQP